MAPNINWKEIMKVDPDDLPRQEELADYLLISLSKMKAQEVELALEVEKAGEEQAKFENQLKTKVMKLENELEEIRQDLARLCSQSCMASKDPTPFQRKPVCC